MIFLEYVGLRACLSANIKQQIRVNQKFMRIYFYHTYKFSYKTRPD